MKARRRQFGRGYESTWSKRTGATVYSHYWRMIRQEVLERDNFECQLRLPGCTIRAVEADHIIAVSDGGEHTLENARAVCKKCHRQRTAAQGGAASAKKARERRENETKKKEAK